jgi:hypothetical protein
VLDPPPPSQDVAAAAETDLPWTTTTSLEPLMPTRRTAGLTAALALTAGNSCATSATAVVDHPPPGQVLSNFENYFGANIGRDCGYSQPLPANPASSLWLFCDTDVHGLGPVGQWQLSNVVSGSSAAEGPATPGEVPAGLSELTTPGSGVPPVPNHDGPAHFLSPPAGLITRPACPATGPATRIPPRGSVVSPRTPRAPRTC